MKVHNPQSPLLLGDLMPEDAIRNAQQYGLFGLLFAFMNRLQATGDSFYEEITCKQFFLMTCMNLFPEEAPTANQLAQVMGCTRQNVKEVLNSLCKKRSRSFTAR